MLLSLDFPPGEEEESAKAQGRDGPVTLQKMTTLEDMIRSGHLEPRHSLRLWLEMLKVLTVRHREGTFFGTLSPGAVLIDMKNNVVLVQSPFDPHSPYGAPEFIGGEKADDQADIYSMGVMLFEMLAGTLEGLHRIPPSRVKEGVPKWIDPVVMRCIMKPRSRRFLDLEELSQSLVGIKKNMQALKGG